MAGATGLMLRQGRSGVTDSRSWPLPMHMGSRTELPDMMAARRKPMMGTEGRPREGSGTFSRQGPLGPRKRARTNAVQRSAKLRTDTFLLDLAVRASSGLAMSQHHSSKEELARLSQVQVGQGERKGETSVHAVPCPAAPSPCFQPAFQACCSKVSETGVAQMVLVVNLSFSLLLSHGGLGKDCT